MTIDPNATTFRITLADGSSHELRYPWPAIERAASWVGLPWLRWQLLDHRQLSCVLAAGLLHADKTITPEKLAERLQPSRLYEYQAIADEAFAYALTGKTQAQREEERKAKEEEKKDAATGEATAAS